MPEKLSRYFGSILSFSYLNQQLYSTLIMIRCLSIIILSVQLFWFGLHAQNQVDSVMAIRAQHGEIQESIQGALIFLADRQIKDLPGQQSALFDTSEEGEGCKTFFHINIPMLPTIRIEAGEKRQAYNISGGWAGMIHALPNRIGIKGKSILSKPDFNHFIPMAVVYPLFLIDESDQSQEFRLSTTILKRVWTLSGAYKKNTGFNFWLPLKKYPDFRGPSTLDTEFLHGMTDFLSSRFYAGIKKVIVGKSYVPNDSWMWQTLNFEKNPSGAVALFNLPNDADDTALALAFQSLRMQLIDKFPDDEFLSYGSNYNYDYEALDQLQRWRDSARVDSLEDGRDSWKGRESGAYLTWLKDEKEPVFGDLSTGVIPLGKNNVDGVVNANVLFALALASQKDIPGYFPSISLIEKAIAQQSWPACGLYYPQLMIFPYAASRAYRDGEIQELRPSMGLLLKQVLAMGEVYAKEHPFRTGGFPGGEDETDQLSTALALCTLLNISREVAIEEGLENWYDRAIAAGIEFLIKHRTKTKILHPNLLVNQAAYTQKATAYCWQEGIYFSSSYRDLAHWRSEAFTTAMVLEALTKYLLAWDYGHSTIMQGRKLKLNYLAN